MRGHAENVDIMHLNAGSGKLMRLQPGR